MASVCGRAAGDRTSAEPEARTQATKHLSKIAAIAARDGTPAARSESRLNHR